MLLILKRGEEKEKERRERNIGMKGRHPSVASHTHPDQEWNPKPFVYKTMFQPIEPPRAVIVFLK